MIYCMQIHFILDLKMSADKGVLKMIDFFVIINRNWYVVSRESHNSQNTSTAVIVHAKNLKKCFVSMLHKKHFLFH